MRDATSIAASEPRTDDQERDTAPARADKVLYIGGQLRSGSTLLGRLLGELDGFVNIGEVVYLFEPYLQNRLCGCGQPLRQCDFWNAVMDEAFGGYGKVDMEAIQRTKRSLERLRCAPKLLIARNSGQMRRQIQAYVDILDPLYVAIRKVSGARVLVDTSKSTLYAYFLGLVPSVDLRVVHLLRDSRAVAYSCQRRKANPAVHWKQHRIGTVSPARVALEWSAQNALMHLLRPGGRGYEVMRYEDVAREPRAAVDRCCALLGEPLPPADFLRETTVSLGVHHTATGNPDRFLREITIRPDLEWREKMARKDRAVVTGLTLPMLLFYGYGRSIT